jgi:glycosyltransferase involved in cell wall biosynthesis
MPLKVAILTTDKRDHVRDYDNPTPGFGTAPEALLRGFALLPEAEIHVVSCTQRPLHAPEKIAPNIFFHSLLVPKLGWLRTGYQGCIRAVRRELHEIQPDIVHGQGTERDCALEAVFSGFPNVLTIHGIMRLIARVNRATPFSFEWLAARLESFTVPRTQGVICITEHTRQAVAGDRVPTWVLPNAVDDQFFEVIRAPAPEPTILCVGTICPLKNQNLLIRALDPIAAQKPLRLVFCGAAHPADPYAREFLSLAGKRPWIEYVPWANRAGLRQHLSGADLLALPSLEDNCPMAVLEAMAAGVPVIASHVGGLPNLVEDGATGLLLPPNDRAGWEQAIRRLLADPTESQGWASAARETAMRRFHPQVVAEGHLEIYRRVLG